MPEWFTQLLAPLGVGIAVYAGIRVDLAIAKSKADQALASAGHAHGRIDRLLEQPSRH
jgi:hypothetical protein